MLLPTNSNIADKAYFIKPLQAQLHACYSLHVVFFFFSQRQSSNPIPSMPVKGFHCRCHRLCYQHLCIDLRYSDLLQHLSPILVLQSQAENPTINTRQNFTALLLCTRVHACRWGRNQQENWQTLKAVKLLNMRKDAAWKDKHFVSLRLLFHLVF